MISTVKYQVATHSGEVKVYGVHADDDPETVSQARARSLLEKRVWIIDFRNHDRI